jgi:hypothetical protein
MKKTKLLSIVVLIFSLFQIISAQPDTVWTRIFGGSNSDIGYSVQQTNDKGYIIVGYTSSFGNGGYDIWFIKTDANGNKIWDKTFGGNYDDYGYYIQQTSDGGFVISGGTTSYGAGGFDIWLIKTDANGNLLWDKTFGGSSNDNGSCVMQTTDGGFIITGYTASYGEGNADVWLIRTDSNGNKLWDKTFGGGFDDYGNSARQTNDGGFIFTGRTDSYGAGAADGWLIRTDDNGNILWDKTFGGSSFDTGYSLQITSDNGFIISGRTQSNTIGGSDVWLIKTDANGNKIWEKTFGGYSYNYGTCVQLSADNGYIIAGHTRSNYTGKFDVWIIKTDINGDSLWTKIFGGVGDDYGNSVQQTSDGGYIIAGYTNSFGDGNNDVWLLKLGPNENAYSWEINIGVETGIYTDLDNIAGTSLLATDTFDIGIDVPEPPLPTQDYMQLYFPHPEWNQTFTNFSIDIRHPVSLLYYQIAYDFCIATDQMDQAHTITVTPQNGINYTDGLYIQDISSSQLVKLTSAQNSYTFIPTSAGIYDFKLIAGRLYPVQKYQVEYQAGWNMISLPLNPVQKTVIEMFGDDLTSPGYFYQYTGKNGYKSAEILEQGQGYWLGLLEGQTLDYEGDSLDAVLSVTLYSGNNLVGNPFMYKIGKSNLTFTRNDSTLSFEDAVNKGWLSAAMHYWDNQSGGSYLATDILELGCGAWMYALVDVVTMHIQPGEVKSLAKITHLIDNDDWEVELILKSAWAGKSTSRLGEYSIASDGFDANLDYPKPPNAPSGKILSGYFEHENWSILGPRYDRDIKAISNEETHWEYTVYFSDQGNLTLGWELTNLPSTISLELYDPVADVRVDMLDTDEYTFNYQNTQIIEIIKTVGGEATTIEIIPREFKLSQNFPNPFNPITTIQYQLPKSENISISIFNLRGEKVKDIVSSRQEAGYYSVQVDFSDLSSGIYLYRLKAGKYCAFKKCMVLK